MSELARIQNAYFRRGLLGQPPDLRSPGALFYDQEVERRFVSLLRRYGLTPLEGRKVLDVGSAGGFFLRTLVKYRARPMDLFGVDLWFERLAEGHRLLPCLGLACADGRSLPFAAGQFDLVIQRTMFSSIPNPSVGSAVGREMLRVLKPGGVILSYDFRFKRPRDHDVCTITRRELQTLFPGCRIAAETCGLPPPFIRLLASRSLAMCQIASSVWPLKTHYWAAIKKDNSQSQSDLRVTSYSGKNSETSMTEPMHGESLPPE